MLAVQNNCCWVTSLAPHMVGAVLVLHPGSINAKVFGICFHVLRSDNGAHMEIIAHNLSANNTGYACHMPCHLRRVGQYAWMGCKLVQDNLVLRVVLKRGLKCGQVDIPQVQ